MGNGAQKTHLRRMNAGLAATALSAAALWSSMPHASAHDVVVECKPADGAGVEEFPETIVLEFSGEPREGFNTVAVTDSNGQTVFDAEPVLDGRTLTVEVPDGLDTPDGAYSLGYQITSSDGHATRGGLEFIVGDESDAEGSTNSGSSADSKSTETDESTDNADESGGIGAVSIIIAIGAVAAALAVIVLLIQKRKRFDN